MPLAIIGSKHVETVPTGCLGPSGAKQVDDSDRSSVMCSRAMQLWSTAVLKSS